MLLILFEVQYITITIIQKKEEEEGIHSFYNILQCKTKIANLYLFSFLFSFSLHKVCSNCEFVGIQRGVKKILISKNERIILEAGQAFFFLHL